MNNCDLYLRLQPTVAMLTMGSYQKTLYPCLGFKIRSVIAGLEKEMNVKSVSAQSWGPELIPAPCNKLCISQTLRTQPWAGRAREGKLVGLSGFQLRGAGRERDPYLSLLNRIGYLEVLGILDCILKVKIYHWT